MSAGPLVPPTGGPAASPGGRARAKVGRRRLVVLGVVTVLVAAAAAVAFVQLTPRRAAGGQPVCGRALAFVGASAGFVESVYQATELAVAQYDHAHPTCQVSLTRYDTKGAPDAAKASVDKVVNDPAVIGVIGPAFSNEVLAAGPDLQAAGLPMITPSATDPGLGKQGWSVFHRLLGTDLDEAHAAAATLTSDGAKRVLVVDVGSGYPHLLASTVSASLGPELAGTATLASDQTDLTAVVNQATRVKADAVYDPDFSASAGTLLRRLRDAHVSARFLGSASLVDDPQFAQAAGGAATSATFTCGCRPAQGSTAAADFVKQFQQQYGTPPAPYSGFGYDAAKIFLDGIAGAVTSRSGMQAFVQSRNHSGVMGDYRFAANGELAAGLVQVSLFTATTGTSTYARPAR
jgi:branched-chain amino acid transport system substrate-binding protein